MALYNSPTEAQQQEINLKRTLASLNVLKPCKVTALYPDRTPFQIQVQVTDKIKVSDGAEVSYIEMPLLDAYVLMPHTQATDFSITMPIKVGDTGILLFSDKALGSFLQYGESMPPQTDGDASQNSIRSHSLTDAIYLAGMDWQGNSIKGYNHTPAIEIRNGDRSERITVTDDDITIHSTDATEIKTDGSKITATHKNGVITVDDGKIEITHTASKVTIDASGQIQIEAPAGVIINTSSLAITSPSCSMSMANGKVGIQGDIECSGDIKAGNISLQGHIHGGVQQGSGQTLTPS